MLVYQRVYPMNIPWFPIKIPLKSTINPIKSTIKQPWWRLGIPAEPLAPALSTQVTAPRWAGRIRLFFSGQMWWWKDAPTDTIHKKIGGTAWYYYMGISRIDFGTFTIDKTKFDGYLEALSTFDSMIMGIYDMISPPKGHPFSGMTPEVQQTKKQRYCVFGS